MRHQRLIGSTTVIVECGDDLRPQAEGLLGKLAELHERGPALRDGTTIEFGWAPLRLRAADGGLLVCEPDFDGNPWQDWAPTVDRTLRVLSGQVALLNTLGVAGVPARFDDKVVAARGCLDVPRIYLERVTPEAAHDSGWYIDTVDGPDTPRPPDELEGLYVYQLLARRPPVLPLLALPPGYLAVMNGDEVEGIADADGTTVWPA